MDDTKSQELWDAVDAYIGQHLVSEDSALRAATRATVDAGLPQIAVAPNQGKLLYLLARLMKARRVLEIGTLAGYSTIWLARAVAPKGRVVTLEYDPKHAEVARGNIARAKLGKVVDVRVGAALDSLPALQRAVPFDLVFIDADKRNIPKYFEWSLKLTRSGALIVVDNVVRKGDVINMENDHPDVLGVRRFNEMLAKSRRVSATTIQTVGSKGHDGITFALVL
jgi:predicted O-methyltransferase YrrM